MLGANHRVLNVAEQGVNPVELGVHHADTLTAGDVAVTNVGQRIEGSPPPETVTDDLAPGRNRLFGAATSICTGETVPMAKLNTLRGAVVESPLRSAAGHFCHRWETNPWRQHCLKEGRQALRFGDVLLRDRCRP